MNEFFTSLACKGNAAFEQREVDGAGFWSVLSGPARPLDAIAASGHPMPELLYPYASGRFRPETGVPAIAHMSLPALTPDPDALHDDLAAVVPTWPTRTPADHYRELFAELGRRERTSVVVERSGASLAFLPALRTIDLTVKRDLVMRTPIPLAAFGQFWSHLIAQGVEELTQLPPGHRMSLTYEDILDRPEHHFTRLATFAGAEPHPAWLREACASVIRTDRRPVTDPDTLAACAPGNAALEHQARLFRPSDTD
ncbi:hypothetical protein ACFCXT_23390 [Streptomyces vinaceus]|uniref:hypothetical protein n=1 Tax=Streptomyces vinaceus TaxID=1960 RepID=UPI0035DA3902